MTRSALLLSLLALAACSTTPAPSLPGSYRAIGTEPFWGVTIGEGRIVYNSMNGPNFSITAPAPRSSISGRRYETERITIDITHGECSDGMSDRTYPDRVRVVVDGETLNGCGGAPVGDS